MTALDYLYKSIPRDVWNEIFRRLGPKDIAAMNRVCRTWYESSQTLLNNFKQHYERIRQETDHVFCTFIESDCGLFDRKPPVFFVRYDQAKDALVLVYQNESRVPSTLPDCPEHRDKAFVRAEAELGAPEFIEHSPDQMYPVKRLKIAEDESDDTPIDQKIVKQLLRLANHRDKS